MKEQNIHDLLQLAVEKDASDLILTVGASPVLRIHGELEPIDHAVLKPEDVERLVFSVLREDQKHKLESKKELDFSLGFHGLNRFRVNVYYQRGSLACAIRAIPGRIPSFAELGLPAITATLSLRPQGLILITGPIPVMGKRLHKLQ